MPNPPSPQRRGPFGFLRRRPASPTPANSTLDSASLEVIPTSPAPEIPPHDIFISYNRGDAAFADYVYQKLSDSRITSWMDRDAIHPGDAWESRMLQAVDDSKAVALILSPESLASSYVRKEYTRALAKGIPIFPLLYRAGGTLPEALSGVQIIDCQHAFQYDRAMVDLVRSLQQLLHPDRYVPPTGPISRPLRLNAVIEPTSMPRPLWFTGREQEVAQVITALQQGDGVAVCAVQGMAGIGKSALAAVAVDRLRTDKQVFPGGAAWISAESLKGETGLDTLMGGIAFTLSFDDVALMPTTAGRLALLVRHLTERPRTLLAIDNLEPTFPAAALVQALTIPHHTALLLTSRQQIDAPLPTQLTLAPLPEEDAETFFQRRLHQADATRPTDEERPLIAAVTGALGGLPLALELTAAYTGKLHHQLPRVLADIQEHGLGATPLDTPQRGLRYSFQRSWQALTATQQSLFAGLSLIEGATFLRAAAEALGSEAAPTATAQVDTLVQLALVEGLPRERLRLHPFLREYAQEQFRTLPSTQHDDLGSHMLAFWLGWTQAHQQEVFVIEGEAESLMGALTYAHEHARHQDLITLVKRLNNVWTARGRRSEHMKMVRWALEAAISDQDVYHQWWMQHELAFLDGNQGRIEEARAGYQRALDLARQLGDLSAEQGEVHGLAVLDGRQGRIEEARAGYQRALDLARQLGDLSAEQGEVHGLAVLDGQQGRMKEARAGYQRALDLARQLGDLSAERDEIHELAVQDGQQGRIEEARAGYQRALDLARQLGDLSAEQGEVHGLAVLDGQQGRMKEARAGFQRALDLARQLGDLSAERDEVHDLAVLDAQHGRVEEAQVGYQRALDLALQLGDQRNEAMELRSLGGWIGQHGQAEEGVALIRQAIAISERLGDIEGLGDAYQQWAYINGAVGDIPERITHFRQALAYFTQIGAMLYITEIRRKLRNLGITE